MSDLFNEVAEGLLTEEESEETVFTEAVYPDSLIPMRMLQKQIMLPQGSPVGKGNIAFLYTHNIDESIEIINSNENCLRKNKYRYYYFNFFYQGKIRNKKFRYRMFEERKGFYEKITSETGLITRKKPVMGNDNKNMYYDLFEYIKIFTSICNKIQPLRYIQFYWDFMKKIFTVDLPGYNNRFVIVNMKHHKLEKDIRKNLENPLYLIYYTLYRRPDLLKDVNMDFYFYYGRRILKVNPSTCDDKSYVLIRNEMHKLMRGVTDSTTLNLVTDEEQLNKEEMTATVTATITTVADDFEEIHNSDQLVQMKKVTPVEKEIESKVKAKVDRASELIGDAKVDENKVAEVVERNVKKEIDDDHEMIRRIYYQNKSKEKAIPSAVSSARDKFLRENQQKLKVGNMTLADIQKINSNSIVIPVHDISKKVTTTNKNMTKIRFDNLDKTYNTELMKKDIINSITSLNDKSIPLYIRDINVEDTSDELNYKDTYTIYFEDENRKRHTVKVDIPKFIEGRFLYIGGNKKVIKHQSFFLPVVKIAPNKVEIVTNYSKMTIERVDNTSSSAVERMKKMVSSNSELSEYFVAGTAYPNNRSYITTLEYDDYSKMYTAFKQGNNTNIMFDQTVAEAYCKKHDIIVPQDKLYIGKVKGVDTYIDINTQTTDDEKTISDLILGCLPASYEEKFGSIKSPKRLMYAKVKIMKQNVSVGMLLGLWEGLSSLLKKLKVDYRLVDKVGELSPDEEFIKFNDTIMVYKQDIPTSLILNGFRMFDTSKYSMASFDEKEPYIEYISKVYGRVIIENALMNFYEFVIDPITKEVLEQLDMPTQIVDLYIYAINLLADSQYTNSINQNLSRIRCGEIIPAILYERLSKNYVTYRNSNGRKKYTVPQNCVIKELLAQKTVEDYSTLNPTLEMEMIHAVSTKGFRGVNLDDSYTMEKRGYDNSMIGIIAPNTSPDGSVGISRTLTLEPEITNLRGIIQDKHEHLDELKDTNLFSPGELTIPLAATVDDPNRLGHALKQSKHVIPVKNSSPVLISNGMEEVARFHLTDNFVVNAEEDGEIVDYDEESKIMIAKYKSGKCRAIDLSPNIVKNGGGGFFLSNVLETKFKVGDKFKKDDVLAYHKDFFKNDEFNNCRMNMGTLTKVAIMSTYNTYEDATVITHKMSEDCASEMCFCKAAVVGKNSNVFYMIQKGDSVMVGDPLIEFDTSYEDETINTLLANLGEEDKENILEGARNEIKSKYSGVIEDIKIYSTVDLDEMNPSLKKIVSKYYREINKKKEFLDKYDPDGKKSIVKCGMLVNETTHKIEPNQFGVIKGEHVEDGVLIEFYIKHTEPLEIGSKIA
jgi:hypothetical protein